VDFLPAIDIRNGRVVRLSQGEQARQTVYGDDPVATAERFAEQGARWIHVVDLDRAFGSGDNREAISRIAGSVGSSVRLQLGGGLRTMDLILEALGLGISRAVIGTAAAVDPGLVPAVVNAIGPDRLAVGVDARRGLVAIRGWTETSATRAEDLVRQVLGDGISSIVYTDIERDGMLHGPDIAGAVALQTAGAQVIVSGGVADAGHIRAACRAGLRGIIVGKALYEGRLTVPEAIEAAAC
jgi:phosphoribosylformimino-5-aminoimidazole carboxamide ribotide isomerase